MPSSLIPFLVLALFALVLFATPAQANPGVIRVTVNGATSGACGATWATACGLQYALKTRAVSGDELWVAAGTYTPTIGTDRIATFQLRNGIMLFGGFGGWETAIGQRNPVANVTVLSGDINVQGDPNDNVYHVVTGSGVNDSAGLYDCRVTGGTANESSSPNDRGGGMYNDNGSPIVSWVTFSGNWGYAGGGMSNTNGSNPQLYSVTFSDNTAYSFGGGIYNFASNPSLIDVTFSGNSVTWFDGGGMYNTNGSNPTLTRVSFSGNSADNRDGGGMYNTDGSNPILNNVTFSDNTAYSNGGGMYNYLGSPTVTNVAFISNTALFDVAPYSRGGGMYNYLGSPTLTNVSFRGNIASIGAAMSNSGSGPTLTSVTFSANSARLYAGGMYNDYGNLMLTNVTFSSNTAAYGGAMYNATSSPTLKHVTLSGNSATGLGVGGGMFNVESTPTIRNTIFWENIAHEGSQIYNDASAPSLYDSVVQNGCPAGSGTCHNILTADPRLGTLGNYSGPMLTIPLLAGSSAVDAADNAHCPPTDQRGVRRPQGAQCDIGAYESIVAFLPLIKKY